MARAPGRASGSRVSEGRKITEAMQMHQECCSHGDTEGNYVLKKSTSS